MDKTLCVVFLCNKEYFNKFIYSCNLLLTNGNYKGDICLIIGDDLNSDLSNDKILDLDIPIIIKNNIIKNNIIIKHFPDIKFSNEFLNIQYKINKPSRKNKKLFQYHKLHLFNEYFKKWDYIFYLDSGITIFSDILPMINEKKENTLLAHSDSYPEYKWKLINQFCKKYSNYFVKLNSKYNLNNDYFQSTMMLYDTNIIEKNTYEKLYNLMLEYPISITNDQGILSLYFTNIKPCFTQIKICEENENGNQYFYEYLSSSNNKNYIMLKSLQNY